LAAAYSLTWVQMPFSFLHNEAEVSHNQALQKEHWWIWSSVPTEKW